MMPFDPSLIKDEAIRGRYQRVLRRGETIAATMRASFGARHAPVRTIFVEENTFNAYATRDRSGYVLEIARPVPLLLLILFEKLLGDPGLFPWLNTGTEIAVDYEVAFIADPVDFSDRNHWKIALTDERSFVAGILSEIATAFIQMHELGHVLAGHIEANHHLTGSWSLAEMVDGGRITRSQLERERAWEADADAIAAGLLVRYIGELVEQTRLPGPARTTFGHESHAAEHILAITATALFAVFAYVRGQRYRLSRHSSHPHPFVRSYYVKDMLLNAGRQEWQLDLPMLASFVEARAGEMLDALEQIGLFHGYRVNDRYIRTAEAAQAKIMGTRAKHRRICSRWASISWS